MGDSFVKMESHCPQCTDNLEALVRPPPFKLSCGS
jgi:hypothetical protein